MVNYGIFQPWSQNIFEENLAIKSLVGLFQELVLQHGIKLNREVMTALNSAKEIELEAVKQYRVSNLAKVE